jgi:predicted dehydrogenase
MSRYGVAGQASVSSRDRPAKVVLAVANSAGTRREQRRFHYTMSSAANNERKSAGPTGPGHAGGPLRVGLVADGAPRAGLCAALQSCLLLQPLGQAGMPTRDGLRAVPHFDDPRTLLAQPGLEAVLLATDPHQDNGLATAAAERGLHVWRVPPLASSFAEAAEVVARARQLPTIYRVASWWEYVSDHVWHELRWPHELTPRFSELRACGPGPVQPGGALTVLGYPLLEALVAARGLPDSVAAAVGRYRQARAAAPAAEDTAVAVLRYSDGGSAVLRATWDMPPCEHQLTHHGPDLSVTLTDEEAQLSNANGDILDRRPLPGDFLATELLRYAEFVRGQARDRAAAPLERHLAVSALLETIDLSARTGHPEAPHKFYEVQGWPEPRL